MSYDYTFYKYPEPLWFGEYEGDLFVIRRKPNGNYTVAKVKEEFDLFAGEWGWRYSTRFEHKLWDITDHVEKAIYNKVMKGVFYG